MCIFCDEIADPYIAKKIFGATFVHDSRIIYTNENIVAIPGYGPQVYPYILVMTRRHTPSFLNITKQERESFFVYFDMLLKSGLYKGNELCIFEHGGEPQNSCSSVTHCHLHIIDGELNFYNYINWNEDQENMILVPESPSLPYDDYLLIGKYKDGELIIKLNRTSINEHQYFRKRLSDLIGTSDWDWNKGMNNDIYVPKLIDEANSKMRKRL